MSLRDELIEKIVEKLYYVGMARMHSRPLWEAVISESKDEWRKEARELLSLEHEGHRLLIGKVEGELPDCDNYRWIDLDKGGWKYDKNLMRSSCPMCLANYVQEVKGDA